MEIDTDNVIYDLLRFVMFEKYCNEEYEKQIQKQEKQIKDMEWKDCY